MKSPPLAEASIGVQRVQGVVYIVRAELNDLQKITALLGYNLDMPAGFSAKARKKQTAAPIGVAAGLDGFTARAGWFIRRPVA
jgi:hypothetical protein